MSSLLFLIPIALAMGGFGLAIFFWAMRSDQFEDLDGAANRILIDDDELSGVKAKKSERPQTEGIAPKTDPEKGK